jgi:uncharacterized protein
LNKAPEIQPFQEIRCASRDHRDEFQSLLEYGGFPEPLLKASPRFLRRWHNEKVKRLFRDDISEVERIRDLGRMKLLSDMLPEAERAVECMTGLKGVSTDRDGAGDSSSR